MLLVFSKIIECGSGQAKPARFQSSQTVLIEEHVNKINSLVL